MLNVRFGWILVIRRLKLTTYICNSCNKIRTEDLDPEEESYRKYGTWLICTECAEKRKESIEEFNLEPD